MSRGYSLVYDEKEEHLIKSLKEVELGDVVNIKLNDGQLSCQVWGMKEDGITNGEGS
ncbi:Exodeoxyribonuclease 7 large subunit [compost metagenome]